MNEQATSIDGQVEEIAATPAPKKLPGLLTARAAIKRLAPFTSGHLNAKQLLVDQLFDGGVRAYAHDRWSSKEKDIEAAWQAGPPATAKRKEQIRKTLLRPRSQLLTDSLDWDWRKGRFFITRGSGATRRSVLLNDVRFVVDDINKLVDALNPKKGAGGRPTETQAWTDFWLEIMEIALAGKLTKEHPGGREKFAAELFVRLGWHDQRRFKKPPLALETLKTPAGKVWDRFVEPKKR